MMQMRSASTDEDMVRGRRMRATERCGKASRDHLWLFPDTPDTGHTAARGFFLGSIYIDRGPLNETRPSSSVDAEPPRPLKGISSWFDRGPRPGAIRTATMQASTQAIEPSRSAECLHMRSGTSERENSRLTVVLSKVGVRGRKLWQVPIARTVPGLPSSMSG